MRRLLSIALASAALLLSFQTGAFAQFKEEAFSQSYNDDDPAESDSVQTLFSFKEFFGGLAHKNELKIGTMFAGSTVFVGSSQIYNKQYWKLPIVYGGLAGTAGAGLYFRDRYAKTSDGKWKTASTLCFVGTGLAYWGTLMDGVLSYEPAPYPLPGKATLFSVLVPGLGQAYNGEFWKIPIYWGGMIGAAHFWRLNEVNYQRFRRIYREATSTEVPYTGPIGAETAKYYRDVYLRYRDYSIVTLLGVYLLQVIDANVFSYMYDFEVSDDITMRLSPTVMGTDNQYAFSPAPGGVGMRLGITF